MSHGPSDLESRVSTLERQMRIVTADAGDARMLARAVDEDVSNVLVTVRANQNLINLLRETQVDQGKKLDALVAKVDNLAGVVAEQGLVQAEHSATLAGHTATLAEHGRKLDALDAKIDSRFDEVLALLRQRPES